MNPRVALIDYRAVEKRGMSDPTVKLDCLLWAADFPDSLRNKARLMPQGGDVKGCLEKHGAAFLRVVFTAKTDTLIECSAMSNLCGSMRDRSIRSVIESAAMTVISASMTKSTVHFVSAYDSVTPFYSSSRGARENIILAGRWSWAHNLERAIDSIQTHTQSKFHLSRDRVIPEALSEILPYATGGAYGKTLKDHPRKRRRIIE